LCLEITITSLENGNKAKVSSGWHIWKLSIERFFPKRREKYLGYAGKRRFFFTFLRPLKDKIDQTWTY